MARYKIELRTQNRVWDSLPVEAEDHTALRIEVAQFVGQVLKDHAAEIWADEDWRVDVTDDTGLILYVMHLMVTNSAATVALRR